jgi:hypothetical protein
MDVYMWKSLMRVTNSTKIHICKEKKKKHQYTWKGSKQTTFNRMSTTIQNSKKPKKNSQATIMHQHKVNPLNPLQHMTPKPQRCDTLQIMNIPRTRYKRP